MRAVKPEMKNPTNTGYIAIVSLESIENATVLAALTFIDIGGALIGAVISNPIYRACGEF